MRRQREWGALLVVAAVAAGSTVIMAEGGQGRSVQARAERGYKAPTISRGSPARPLTPPGAGRAEDRARQFVRANGRALGLSSVEIDDMKLTGESTSPASAITHIYLHQRLDGITVFGAVANLSVDSAGRILVFGHSFLPNVSAVVNRRTAGIAPADAVQAAARHVGLEPTEAFEETESLGGAEQYTRLTDGGIATGPVVAQLVFQPLGPREVRLAWQVDLEENTGHHLWRMTVDAETGEVLHTEDYTSWDNWDPVHGDTHNETHGETAAAGDGNDGGGGGGAMLLASPDPVIDGSSYLVFAHRAESPNDAPQSLVTNPADAQASPFGWHDTNGTPGPEFTLTRGNNVHAYFDQDQNNAPDVGFDVDGGAGLSFEFPADLNEHAQNYREAVVTNLFYWNNLFHDVMWQYGFNEASGNFQVNNYGRGGGQGDYVRAEAADGGGTNNANFSTPAADSGTPRMQMYLWPGNQFGPQNQVVVGAASYAGSWARFSPAPTVAGTSGSLFDAVNGCDAAAYAGNPGGSWIAIVTGGNTGCQNVVKAREATLAGASALIVTHTAAGAAPILSGALTVLPVVSIPVVSVGQADGNAIRAAGAVAAAVRKHPDHPGIRDGDFEAGIIIHEYAHGVSNRLTGGPGINCLSGNEQMGEGWSDWYALAVLIDPALDNPQGPRGMGPYALFQNSRQGAGIRPRPYSRTMSIQPFTYDSIKTGGWINQTSLAAPHGIGHGWAAVLWDMTWDLIDKHGFNADVYDAWNTGGNNRALQYVTDGLKLQGCGPGFVAGRNAIIAAAEALDPGDVCTVWASFARRGLGFSAIQGTTNRDDNAEAFDTHPACRAGFQAPVAKAASTMNVRDAGDTVSLRFQATPGLGAGVLASNSPFSRRVDCDTRQVPSAEPPAITPREYPVPTETPGESGISSTPKGVYHYNWKTDAAWAGTCREVVLTRADGVQHRAFFQFVAPN